MYHGFNFGDEEIVYYNGKYYNMSNMKNKSKSASSGGLGIVGVAQIVFIILKLCNLIDWKWWVVLSPLWGSAALCIVVIGVAFLIGTIIGAIKLLKG